MKKRYALPAAGLFLLFSALACNLSRSVTSNPPQAGTEPPAVTEPSAATEGPRPSGLPILTLQGGSGYLFDTGQVVTGSNDRDVWWNAIFLVPGNRMASLGNPDTLEDISQVTLGSLSRDQDEPVPGEVFVVEVTQDVEFALLRILTINPESGITFEYLFPFPGQIVP